MDRVGIDLVVVVVVLAGDLVGQVVAFGAVAGLAPVVLAVAEDRDQLDLDRP